MQRVGLLGLLGSAVALLLGTALQAFYGSVGDGPRDGSVQLLPWLTVVVIFAVALAVSPPIRLGLVAAGIVILLKLALPLLVTFLPGTVKFHPIWIDASYSPDQTWITSIAEGSAFPVWAGDALVWLGALAAVAFTIVTFIGLRDLLLRPPSRASFSIDLTVLLTIFTLVCLGSVSAIVYGGVFSSGLDIVTASNLLVRTLLLVWLVPLVLWLAFTLRQGGIVAVGSTGGLVAVFLVIPFTMNQIATSAFGGNHGALVLPDSAIATVRTSYDLVDRIGFLPAGGAIAVVMFIVALWWGLGTHAGGNPDRALGTTTSPVNNLSVVSFVLAWIPLTALPAVVLAHMSYDQIVDGDSAQRGLGLSRWAIVLGYISVVGAAALAYNFWLA
jgi:hypothetical protein